ncbi:MAG: NADH-quinone oxidoreductase subunit A [Deltaproteobacteria bacterium]|nr:NADH-quinone oxidoreductase subunit A [Deltaproteobacteria bacterium]
MEAPILEDYAPFLWVLLLAVGISGLFVALSYFFGPQKPTASKLDVYECGVPIKTSARERFSVKFFMVAMIFLLFDVEMVFLFPWAVKLHDFKVTEQAWVFAVPMLIFLVILGLGLIYEWRRGALDWEK